MTIVQSTVCRFHTTSWTLIARARDGDGLTELLERYWSPIYAYLRRSGHNETEALEELFDEPGFWWMAAQYLVILHLVTFLSLFIKWAALPMTLGIIVFTNWCCLWTMFEGGGSSSNGPFVVMCLLSLFVVVVLHFAIAERLRSLAAR